MFLDLCLQFFNLSCTIFFSKFYPYLFFPKNGSPLCLSFSLSLSFFLQNLDIWIPLKIIKSSKHFFFAKWLKAIILCPSAEIWQALNKYGRDLVADAEAGKLDPVIGRDEEIRRVIQDGFGGAGGGPGNVDGKDYPLVN